MLDDVWLIHLSE